MCAVLVYSPYYPYYTLSVSFIVYGIFSVRSGTCELLISIFPLQWRHNESGGVSNNQRLDCLHNRLCRRRSKKTSKFRVTGLWEWSSHWIHGIYSPIFSVVSVIPMQTYVSYGYLYASEGILRDVRKIDRYPDVYIVDVLYSPDVFSLIGWGILQTARFIDILSISNILFEGHYIGDTGCYLIEYLFHMIWLPYSVAHD